MTADEIVRLRPVQPGDLPRMYELQLDPESNRMAVTIPRIGEAFDSHWAKALGDPAITARAVLLVREHTADRCFSPEKMEKRRACTRDLDLFRIVACEIHGIQPMCRNILKQIRSFPPDTEFGKVCGVVGALGISV